MFTFLFTLIAMIPIGIGMLILKIAPECNKVEAGKPFLIATILMILGLYLDYTVILGE